MMNMYLPSFYRLDHLITLICFLYSNDTASTPTYFLSLHDALPISYPPKSLEHPMIRQAKLNPVQLVLLKRAWMVQITDRTIQARSEEHTSELQSRFDLVCRLLLEKKKIMDHLIKQLDVIDLQVMGD